MSTNERASARGTRLRAAILAAAVLAVLGGATAHAARRMYSNVQVEHREDERGEYIRVQGNIALVASLEGTDEHIFCGTGAHLSSFPDGETFEYAHCNAVNSVGDAVYCFATDPALVRVAASVNDASLVFFEVRAGQCTTIQVNSGSPFGP
jgi:hypothetical protein